MSYRNQLASDCKFASLSVEGPGHKLSDNFTLIEFACKDGNDNVMYHPSMIELLQVTRDHYGLPVHINSAYRTWRHNLQHGGRPSSKHLWGMASDLWIAGVPPTDLYSYLDSLGVGGLGKYNTFTHADVFGQNRRWDFR